MGSLLLALFLLPVILIDNSFCLFPKESSSREVKKLDGIWNFRICRQNDQEEGFREKWYKKNLVQNGDVIPMPVPCSYNDVTQNKTIRDYVGWAWYDTTFYVPQRWKGSFQVILRFGSAHYVANVFLNGVSVVNHTGGHLPFEVDVTAILDYSGINLLTVALNNTLSDETVPQGSKTFKSKPYPPGFYEQTLNFDFFNYAGIHRSVILYALPLKYIKDILILTDIKDNTGLVKYSIWTETHELLKISNESFECFVAVLDKMRNIVASKKGCNETIIIEDPHLWWPYTMYHDPGYLYSLQVKLTAGDTTDVYEERFGIRTVAIERNKFLINGKPFYFMGFGKHEDSIIRGKGIDLPLVIKDFNLIKWVGANSFRTSHYPYAEEIMDQADEQGIVVINECPAVGLQIFSDTLMKQHCQTVRELISRDKNRPSVVAWSVANEPKSSNEAADAYFKKVVSYAKQLDQTRPITAAINADPATDKLGKYLDYVMMNRYFSWYSDTGSTEVIYPLLVNALSEAFEIYQKPIMMSEYGGDTIAGLHMDPPFIFTEDYQSELMLHHHQAFDTLRQKGFFVGEHIWNFADFMTLQEIFRVVGNKKGIFTRERQPKAAAKFLRCRYHKIANLTIVGSVAYCPYNENTEHSISCDKPLSNM